ncbi:EAL domain-containing protein [Erythrobacteraceae bacterium CFH 75059]|uniref:putative bifunctional diguanylate cyclase/phosphodiesterase n=1 Tax=Qipengyuania thermophila TaxID=2509361 RepID=UPI0010200364|nr:EAL domain-containing protein [Qipengyuania thermophila]TCD05034.1 EAL domain-containing protein [Erythrobacteraceae bacterium CFH 75059]
MAAYSDDIAAAKLRSQFTTLLITYAGLALFVWIGGHVLGAAIEVWTGGTDVNRFLTNALVLNIAVIVMGWLRYNRLSQELAERTAAEREARRLAEVDELTQCHNRRSFIPALNTLLQRCAVHGQHLLVFLVDLDNFKQINDRLGHATGDDALKAVANALRAHGGGKGVIARLGGDEFVCAFPADEAGREQGSEQAAQLLEAIRASCAAPEHGPPVDITVSVGIVGVEPGARPGLDAEKLLRAADLAMYQAKRSGKNRFSWYDPGLEEAQGRRIQLEEDIRAGLRNGEFVPYYEQQVDLETGELLGFEMLARWHSASRGLVLPSVFIPIAEESGLVAQLSEQLIAKAFIDARDWDPQLTLSVNISPIQLRDPWFSHRVLKLLVEHNFSPSRLIIEITESCLHTDVEEVRTMVTSLRNQGVKISLDDFGTGYAGLNQLRDLSFDHLKIDRSFVQGVDSSGTERSIVEAIVALGSAMNIPVTAEGVESDEVRRALRTYARIKAQGYHYGRPEDGAAVRRRLESLGRLASQCKRSDLPSAEAPQDGTAQRPDVRTQTAR